MPTQLTGPQKAALILVQLGTERAAPVLRTMSDEEVEELMTEVSRLEAVHDEVLKSVLTEFVEAASARMRGNKGGMSVARALLEQGLGADRAEEIMARIDGHGRPFECLRTADPRQLLTFLIDEHPQTIALVLAHLVPEQAASLLAELPAELQGDVAHRIAVMERPSPEVVRHVEEVLERKLAALAEGPGESSAGGVQPLVNILNRSDPTSGQVILNQLELNNPDLADEIRRRMFVFQDIVKLDDRGVQLVLREVDAKDLAVALKGTAPEVKSKV
ncbi:MAG: flagellar motor switch protein FliG, partial [Acidimicrobiaceae bacterium]|nr:flagellar motor switch protein FliG [Acidimicrobiaceae bacterium]